MRNAAFHYTVFLLATFLFLGCSSTGEKKVATVEDNAAEKSAEELSKPENIRINDFTLGRGDTIEVDVYRHDELKVMTKIDMTGVIMFPLIGDVRASGISVFSLRDNLNKLYAKYVTDPQVMIRITGVQSQKLTILGEVNNPGIYSLDQELTVSDIIGKSNGFASDANTSKVILYRKVNGKVEGKTIDVYKIMAKGDLEQDIVVKSDDLIYVPKMGIAITAKYMAYISQILAPLVTLETGIVLYPEASKVIAGKSTTTTKSISVP